MGACISIKNIDTDEIPEFGLIQNKKYKCKIVNIYDGDTCDILLKEYNRYFIVRIRLSGIDTPEIAPPLNQENRENEVILAKRARNYFINITTNQHINIDNYEITKKDIKNLLQNNKKIIFFTYEKKEKYGRALGILSLKHKININELLIKEGYANNYNGGTKNKNFN